MISAEDFNAIDTKLSTKNDWADLQPLAFLKRKLNLWFCSSISLTDLRGLFCNDAFKSAVERAELNGVIFNVDLGNIFPPNPSARTLATY